MILCSHCTTPFGRHVLMAIHVLGLLEKVTIRETFPQDPKTHFLKVNPLGKIPTLISKEGVFYDSRVILEYLNLLSKRDIFPSKRIDYFKVLVNLSRVLGILDSAILIVYESRLRPKDKFVESIVVRQRSKIVRALNQINLEDCDYKNGRIPNVSEIGLACCLDYLDFRQILDWRECAPNLGSWIKTFSLIVPGYRETYPIDLAVKN